jgi:hypothetical protein
MGSGVPARGPAYSLQDFVAACADGSAVKVLKPAMQTAPSFGLMTEPEVIAWIGNGGLEKPEHANTETWLNNPDRTQPIWVDSYNFFSGLDYGYIAFMFQPKTKNWLIKSLKKNDKPDPRPLPFADKLRKAGWVR